VSHSVRFRPEADVAGGPKLTTAEQRFWIQNRGLLRESGVCQEAGGPAPGAGGEPRSSARDVDAPLIIQLRLRLDLTRPVGALKSQSGEIE
jgi:hypothetical protein